MRIEIVSEFPDKQRGRVLVNLIVDGKKKSWNMSKGLWEFVYELIKKSSELINNQKEK